MLNFKFSFKMKTIFGIAIIETFFLFILVLNSRSILYETIELDIKDQASNISTLLATASVDAVVSQDIATLDSILNSTINTSKILYIRVVGLDGVLAEVGNQHFLNQPFKEDNSIVDSESDGTYDAYANIMIDGYQFGRVEIGLSIEEQQSIIDQATNHLSTIAFVEMLFVALFSLLLGVALTKRLTVLQEATLKVSQGETGLQIPIEGSDEVTDASNAFNLMSKKIGQVTQKLKSDNSRMDTVMNTVTDGIFMVSIEGDIHSMNRSAYRLFGLEESLIVTQSIFDFIPEFNLNGIINSKEKHIQNVEGLTLKGKHVALEIHCNQMEFNNQQYIVGVIRDKTEINRLQYELQAVFNLSPNGFLILANDLSISYVNPAFYSMFSIAPERCFLGGNNWACFTDLIDNSIDYSHHKDLSLLDELLTENILYLKSPVEKVLTISRQKIDIADPDSSDILFFVDITHLTIVDKMKSEFLTTAAHELRTPLVSICGFSELLLARDYDKSTAHEMYSIIHRQSLHLKYLLDELLDLSRIEARAGKGFNISIQDIEAVIKESCVEVEGAFKGRKAIINPAVAWPTALAFDIDKIRQVLRNLLSNAFKYSSKDITLVTHLKEEQGKTFFGISIIDRGIGMTPQQLSRLGERFYRADDSGATPGSGLGVSLVNEIVSIHGGKTEYSSESGQGMTATFWLPLTVHKFNKE
ncbi:ATP-binding protein [Psychromonas sp. 14N.309.X.WAT.B.A12]|uniref:ATP-binding protein n=1 Tax=Psychromonas sp. 14N.309.X.WAT.B.A12 TaxID=2998322 RepID=UPI0025B0AE0A|nr:ATP-binding protein [Psychromonas sp. 14N.309.X.WAT.B.A12]MDN2663583.1 ATP-binding protein [Psychromonas sp. 14N.309.X.WAT.B.A12]